MILEALAGFALAIAMGIVGVSALKWVAMEAKVRFGGVRMVGDTRQRMKGKELDYWADRLATTSKA